MSPLLLVALPGNEAMTARLAEELRADIANVAFHRFPDEETYLRFDTPVTGRSVALVCTLDRPDAKFLPLVFAAATVRELGASRIGLIAPYLAYMRQDRRFQPGEAVTSAVFAKLISGAVDWLVTVDPHLHRHPALSAIYSIEAVSLHAAPLLADWIARNVSSPVLIGPDEESAQWVADVAGKAGAPYLVLEKHRRGDTDVEVSVPDVSKWRDATPVLIDDIVSTGRTMIETLAHLNRAGLKPATCIGVHAIFAEGAYRALQEAGPAKIVTTNTVPHKTNAIDVAGLLSKAVVGLAR